MITPHYKKQRAKKFLGDKYDDESAITLMLDTRTSHEARHFRCCVCGNIVFEYTNPLSIIMAGEPETLKTPTIVQCPHSIRVPKDNGDFVFVKCKTRYYIIK